NEVIAVSDNTFVQYESAKKQTSQLITLVNSINVFNSDFTPKMERYLTEVIAEEVKFLEWGNKPTTDSTYNNGSEPSYQSGQGFGNGNSFDDDIIPVDDGDIPF
ncbi:hypothetical protein AAGC94_18490, partial [Clostridium sporogenes]